MKRIISLIIIAVMLVGCGSNGTVTPSEPDPSESSPPEYTEMNMTMYTSSKVNVCSTPSSNGENLGSLVIGTAVEIMGKHNASGWYRIKYNDKVGYISGEYLVAKKSDLYDEYGGYFVPAETGGNYIIGGYEFYIKSSDEWTDSFKERCKMFADAGCWNPFVSEVTATGGRVFSVMYPENSRADEQKAREMLEEYIESLGLVQQKGEGGFSGGRYYLGGENMCCYYSLYWYTPEEMD